MNIFNFDTTSPIKVYDITSQALRHLTAYGFTDSMISLSLSVGILVHCEARSSPTGLQSYTVPQHVGNVLSSLELAVFLPSMLFPLRAVLLSPLSPSTARTQNLNVGRTGHGSLS